MKTISIVCSLGIFIVSATSLAAQTEATSPATQPTSSPQATAASASPAVQNVATENDWNAVKTELDDKWAEYTSKGNWYLTFYYILTIGAALSSALAGLILQWDTPQNGKKKTASILAFVGAALITVLTYVDFTANARANKAAANQTMRLKLQVQKGLFKDPVEVREKMQDIYEEKQVLGLPKSPTAAPAP
jgi:hypothetical protein